MRRHALAGVQCILLRPLHPRCIMYFFQYQSVFRRSWSFGFNPLQQLACTVQTWVKSGLFWQYPLKYFVSRKMTSMHLRLICWNLIRFKTGCLIAKTEPTKLGFTAQSIFKFSLLLFTPTTLLFHQSGETCLCPTRQVYKF